MSPFSDEGRRKAVETQRKRWGTGYSAEMSRRAKLNTAPRFNYWGWLKENDPQRFKQIIEKREKNRAKKQKIVKGKKPPKAKK